METMFIYGEDGTNVSFLKIVKRFFNSDYEFIQ